MRQESSQGKSRGGPSFVPRALTVLLSAVEDYHATIVVAAIDFVSFQSRKMPRS